MVKKEPGVCKRCKQSLKAGSSSLFTILLRLQKLFLPKKVLFKSFLRNDCSCKPGGYAIEAVQFIVSKVRTLFLSANNRSFVKEL